LAEALPAANAAIAPKPVTNSTLRIVNPPIFRAVGFREAAQFFRFLGSYHYPVRNRETCPRAKQACS
jgi:hypothetical protein